MKERCKVMRSSQKMTKICKTLNLINFSELQDATFREDNVKIKWSLKNWFY